MKVIATATLGHSKFVVGESSAGVLKIVRTNPRDERPAEFFVPRELFVEFAAEYAAEKVKELLR